MKKVKKALRLFILVLLLILGFCGVGLTGNFLNNNRERYMDKEIKIEQVDKKEAEENEDKLKD